MKLKQAKALFSKHYPDGFIRSGKKVGGCTPSRWAVCFEKIGKVYEYTGTLRSVLEKILKNLASEQDWDLLNGIMGRCGNGCPITKDILDKSHCVNCGSKAILLYKGIEKRK